MSKAVSHVFKSKATRKIFLSLVAGIVFIVAAIIFVFNIYWDLSGRRLTPNAQANQVAKVVIIARGLPEQSLKQVLPALQERGVRLRIVKNPPERSIIIGSQNTKQIHRMVRHYYARFNVSLPLPALLYDGSSQQSNGNPVVLGNMPVDNASGNNYGNASQAAKVLQMTWLNITLVHRATHPWIMVGFLISAFVLLCALVALCYWAVVKLAPDFSDIAKATKRFGIDVHAPPLALVGSPEMREVIDAFNEMQNRIRRLLSDRTQMLAAISHDLRTPITRLKLRAEYLNATDSEQYKKAIADLNDMDQMIGSILSFARDYNQEESMQRFDLESLLETICNDAEDLGQDVTYKGAEQRLPFFGRMVALKRALTNVVDNAIKYGKSAEVSLKQTANKITIKILDQGPGIPEEFLEKVFEPFYRVDPARSPETSGTGLGLAVARDIVRSHGGEIELQNQKSGQTVSGLLIVITFDLEE